MKHIKRITTMIMALMILLSSLSSMTVSAASEGVNTTIDPSYRCYKGSDVGTAGTAPIGNPNYYWHYDSTGTYLNCPIRFMKEKGTNMPVYCIEAGKTFDGRYTYKTTDLTDSPYWTSLSATARAGITYTTMYGYPVNNYGAANCDAYAATQTIIWEFEKGYRNLTGRTNSYYYDLMIKGSPAEIAYDRLAADIIAHNKRPSFAYSSSSAAVQNSVELKYNASAGTWSATLLDSNGVLSGYKVTSSGGVTAAKSGNSLILATSSEISGSVSIELARPLPTTGQSLLALYSTSSQNALVGQLSDPVTSFLTVTTENLYGRFTLTKVNESGDGLEGVTFEVCEDEECLTPLLGVNGKPVFVTTDKDGNAVSDKIEVEANGSRKLYIREYSISEIHGDKYELDTTVYPVVITAGMTAQVNDGKEIVNKWHDATLSLIKQDEDGKLMSGVVFAAFDDEACTEFALDIDGKNITLTTDENGYAKSADIEVGKDGARIVYVKEISMTVSDTDVYELNGDVFEVELTAGQNTEVNDGEPFVNEFKIAPVKIRKSDFTTAEGVPGAQIRIFDSAGELVYEGVTLEDGNTEKIELRVGRYTFVETIAPAGYVLNKTVFEFSVNPDKTVTGDCEVKDKPTEWTITKSDITTAEPLAGAEITIYDSNGKEVFKDITKEDGTVTAFYLPAGVYTFKETLAPEGYVINEEIFTFTIDDEGNVTGDNTVTDRKIKGNIKVIKTDEATGEKLAGAVFGLFSFDGKTKLAEGTTGNDGYVTFADLEYGEYVIKELSAPVGFLMKKTEFKVKIAEDGKTYELIVANSREPVITPPTGDSSDNLYTSLVIMVISAGVLGILWFIRSGRKVLDEQDKKKWWRDRRYHYSGWE